MMDRKNQLLPHTHEWQYDNGPDNLQLIISRSEGKVIRYSLVNGYKAAERELALHAEGEEHKHTVWLDLQFPDSPQLVEAQENGVPIRVECHAWGCDMETAIPNRPKNTCAKCNEDHWFCDRCAANYMYPTGHQQGPFKVHPLACANKMPMES